MIFNSLDEIVNDINSKILSYVTLNTSIDMKELISILKNYLYEMRIIDEIDKFDVSQLDDEFKVAIEIEKHNLEKRFIFDISLETRKLKIKKITNRKE